MRGCKYMFMICTSYSLYLQRGLLCCRATRLAKPVIHSLNTSGTLYMINPTATAAVFRVQCCILITANAATVYLKRLWTDSCRIERYILLACCLYCHKVIML